MLAGIFILLLLYFGSPVLVLLLIGIMFKDLAFYYGGWMIPAVFGLTMGIMLKVNGPGDPNADFSSLTDMIAGSHIVGLETPLMLIAIGIFSLMAKPIYRMLKPTA
jgi:hypothetical protein